MPFRGWEVGDEVRYKLGSKVLEGIIGEMSENNVYLWHNDSTSHGSYGDIAPHDGYAYSWAISKTDEKLEPIKKANTMNILQKFRLSLKGEPERTFQEQGITDSNDTLTTTGKEIFLAYLLKKHGDEFKSTVIDPLLKEDKPSEPKE